ncbi:phospholipase D-like domain-containing protein DpdK [Phenylobacterium sp.]|uniref:phospholipase D-like domain-containing protein DpdK n=1 Tax=Phenylobacterium sp. TaxID=1871053 RepID=UPI00356496A1
MTSRDFTGPWQSRAIRDALQTLFLTELLRPSAELWVLSAWISDVEIVDNGARAFSAVRPDWPAGSIRLTQMLEAVAQRGARVAVVVREVDHNAYFLRTLREAQARADGRLGLAISPDAHEKTLVGEDYVFGGSMNFTLSGLTTSDEHVLLRADPQAAAMRRLALTERWGSHLTWR